MRRFFLLLFFGVTMTIAVPASAGKAEEAASAPRTPIKDFQQEVALEFQRNNYKKVIRLYKDFTAKYPDRFVPLVVQVLYSQSLADTGEMDEAIVILKEILMEMPPQIDPVRLHYDLANLLFMQRRYSEATNAYQKILLQASRHDEILTKVRERLTLMREGEGRKKDLISLQLLDIETTLEAKEIPEGAEPLLQNVINQNSGTVQAEQAARLLGRLKEVRTEKARALLDEARRLFDEKKYTEVREILDQIDRHYADVSEVQSVEVLQKALNFKSPRPTKKDTSPEPPSGDQ